MPRDPYSAAKLAAENLVHSWGMKDEGFAYTVVRPFNNYGPGQSYKFLIPVLIRRALRGEMFIYGNSWRDFLYVKDTARAVMAILDNPKRTYQETFNVCSGEMVTVSGIAAAIQKIVSGEGGIQNIANKGRGSERDTDIPRLWGDNSKLSSMLGWSPCYSLATGLRETVEWVKNMEAMK